MLSLPETTRKHDQAIRAHVDRLPGLADLIADGSLDELRTRFEPEYRFIAGQLAPHVETVEATLYPELEKVMGCCHSMLGMRREHQELARLIGSLGCYRASLEAGPLDLVQQTGLRRALYRLHAMLKVHLAEEAMYVGVLEHNLSDQEMDVLARAMDHTLAEPI